MTRWLLNFDEQRHAHHVNRDVPQHEQNPLSVNIHRDSTTSSQVQHNVDRNSSSEPTGTLYLYNQREFYHDTPLVFNSIFLRNILPILSILSSRQ